MILTERPNGIHSEFPQKKYSFNGMDKDYVAEQKKNQYLGNKGEKLVVKYEKIKLEKYGRSDLAEEVRKVKDGEGYDVFSYDKKGSVIYIEVKTTKGDERTPFYMTDNELEFMSQNNNSYRLYRLYNFKPTTDNSDFFILTNVGEKIIKRPLLFEVQIKKQ